MGGWGATLPVCQFCGCGCNQSGFIIATWRRDKNHNSDRMSDVKISSPASPVAMETLKGREGKLGRRGSMRERGGHVGYRVDEMIFWKDKNAL